MVSVSRGLGFITLAITLGVWYASTLLNSYVVGGHGEETLASAVGLVVAAVFFMTSITLRGLSKSKKE